MFSTNLTGLFKNWIARLDTVATNFNWTNTYGWARTVLAVGSLITLCFNDINMLAKPLGEMMDKGVNMAISEVSIFNLLQNNLQLAKIICIFILLVVASGWRPRFTGILHWWVSFSIATSMSIIDGGDQVTQALTLLLIPICLADHRQWHWFFVSGVSSSLLQKNFALIALTAFFVIRLQVAFIYFHAGIGKMDVEEWMNGTAMYYWLNVPLFELPLWLDTIFTPLLKSSLFLTISTWGVLIFELLLFLGLVLDKKWRLPLMVSGILFHFFIILLFGLSSFFFAMTGALILYLGPVQKGFQWVSLRSWNPFKKVASPEFPTTSVAPAPVRVRS